MVHFKIIVRMISDNILFTDEILMDSKTLKHIKRVDKCLVLNSRLQGRTIIFIIKGETLFPSIIFFF